MNQTLLTCRICEDQRYLGLYWKWGQLDLTERTIVELRALKGSRGSHICRFPVQALE